MATEAEARKELRAHEDSYGRFIAMMKWGTILSPLIGAVRRLHHQQLSRSGVKIAVLKESEAGERRVSATPETVKKFIALGASVAVEAGAGEGASIADADYDAAGASVGSRAEALKDADIVLAVQGPDPASLDGAEDRRAADRRADPVRRARADRRLMPPPASRRWRWNSCRASPARNRWTSSPRNPTSPATRRCSTRPPNMAAPSR